MITSRDHPRRAGTAVRTNAAHARAEAWTTERETLAVSRTPSGRRRPQAGRKSARSRGEGAAAGDWRPKHYPGPPTGDAATTPRIWHGGDRRALWGAEFPRSDARDCRCWVRNVGERWGGACEAAVNDHRSANAHHADSGAGRRDQSRRRYLAPARQHGAARLALSAALSENCWTVLTEVLAEQLTNLTLSYCELLCAPVLRSAVVEV